MTTESTQSQPELGPAPDNGQGQSQGHRRRRRRRKNKTTPQGAPQTPQQQSQPQPVQSKPAPQSQGRKKKKFFQKSQAPQPQPGNNMMGGQGKRKSRQKGPREFVGPMDHSYRAVNGNIADGPPSTIQLGQLGGSSGGSNSHGNYYNDNYTPQAAAPVREDAPTRIFCFIEDLFFLAKIQESARKLGVKVEFVKGDKEVVTRILDVPEGERPALLVFDLNNLGAKPMSLIPKFRTRFKKSVSIIGFLSHLQGDLKLKGIEAGCDVVMPRSAFSQSLPNLLRRYGVEEEEEYEPQPV
ncbi:MAG TPA: response regulator [Terracidiphilus sp.]|jgi:hypothetical protein|nr:response regulator [Terracidiphilus sp.]